MQISLFKILALALILEACAAILILKPSYTYIKEIKTTTYAPEKIKKILDDFGKIGYNNLISYSGLKPITIVDVDEIKYKGEQASGVASSSNLWCHISVVKGMSEAKLRYVILHEFLHCYGFKHVNKPGDLMAPIYGVPSEESIREYAEKLRKKLYGE